MVIHADNLPFDEVVRALAVPLVIVQVGSGTVLHRNDAARMRDEASGEPSRGEWLDEHDAPLPGHLRPFDCATRGEPVERRLLQFRTASATSWIVVRVALLQGGRTAVITLEDVTSHHEAQAKLHEAIAGRDELVSMAAHELRSPIAALALVAEQLDVKTQSEDARSLTKLTLRQVRRLNLLVSNLLEVSRLRAGRFELDRERASLADIVRDAVDALDNLARNEQVELELSAETDGNGSWDTLRMELAVTNLVVNAIKYGGRTPVRVRLHAPDGDHAVLTVEDGGPGVAEAEQQRIFSPFSRADHARKAQSLGLGLYIVRAIVSAHGGTIAIDSHPGRTCFTVTLPVQR